ncbi:MAG TPA: thiamine-phosphate kinase [Candidatus Baltobacteraceae bacterium]|nr:thiamine-phosphate kinase [Candidatus Baltobacteraceae bacterium]
MARLRDLIETHPKNARLRSRIGDDAAVWQPSRSHRSVITTDVLVEGRHFTRESMTLHDAGYRAMAANLSDLAAMAARPVLATVALTVPAELSLVEILELYTGMLAIASPCGCAIAGGDTAVGDQLSIAIAAIGQTRPAHVKGRRGARPGDVAAVTGMLGASRAGLYVSRDPAILDGPLAQDALASHRRPTPRIAEGRWLGASASVRAMMDVSDGLAADLPRVCAASGCGAVVTAEQIPVAPSAHSVASALHEDPALFALAGGEDFELLAAIDARAFGHLQRRFRARFGRELFEVGRFTEGSGVRLRKGGIEEPLARAGYDHFSAVSL